MSAAFIVSAVGRRPGLKTQLRKRFREHALPTLR